MLTGPSRWPLCWGAEVLHQVGGRVHHQLALGEIYSFWWKSSPKVYFSNICFSLHFLAHFHSLEFHLIIIIWNRFINSGVIFCPPFIFWWLIFIIISNFRSWRWVCFQKLRMFARWPLCWRAIIPRAILVPWWSRVERSPGNGPMWIVDYKQWTFKWKGLHTLKSEI